MRKSEIRSQTYPEVEPANVVLEDGTDSEPGRVVNTRCRWDRADAGEEHGDIDEAPEG